MLIVINFLPRQQSLQLSKKKCAKVSGQILGPMDFQLVMSWVGGFDMIWLFGFPKQSRYEQLFSPAGFKFNGDDTRRS